MGRHSSRTVTAALLLGLEWLSPGECLQQDPERFLEPLMNWRSFSSETGALAEQIAGSRDRSSAAAARANAASARTAANEALAKQLNLETRTSRASLEDLSAQATAQADRAAEATETATATLKQMQADTPSLLTRAANKAVDEVRRMLSGNFESLSPWRGQALRDYYTEATERGQTAAAPYRNLERDTRKTMQRYQAQASAAAFRANREAALAMSTAAQAAEEQSSGRTVDATQTMESAKALRAQAVQSSGLAKTLQASAEQLSGLASQYAYAAPMASANAERTVDPFGMPPYPVDVNLAFAPPQ